MIDTTTTDWFGLRGREESGWTALQFKRLIDTCDTMDVPIKVRSIVSSIFSIDLGTYLVWNKYFDICVLE